ncbi:MAG: MBL fold metallo-hydrolase, partial [Myxococcales bacterium]|nr:MBL fold metallo-hydrolase [Myxococcales bacterium]
MFGNAPRALWSRWIKPDAENRIPLACRALLVREADGRNVLFETGIGTFFPPDLRARYGVMEPGHVLLDNLTAIGLAPAEVHVIVLSHLHFDHAGGLLLPYAEGQPPKLAFPDARFVVGATAFARAMHPHARDRASFIPELPMLLKATGRLELVEGDRSNTLGPDYRLHFSEGHTPGLMLAEIPGDDGPVLFCGDLIPGRPWVHLPITMGYDRFPEKLIEEKEALLGDLVGRHGRLFFTHDAEIALAPVERDARGRYHAGSGLAELKGL